MLNPKTQPINPSPKNVFLLSQSQKQSEKLTKEVHSSDNADWYTGQYDAKEKGHNEYAGNGGDKRRKKKEPEDGVVIQKQHRGFDIKI